MIAALLPVLNKIIGGVADRVFPNPADEIKRQELQNALQIAMIQNQGAIDTAAADIIKAEASSESWLTSNWRPITMMVFLGLIVARWFGWSAPGIAEAEYMKLWDIMQFGIGGYVASRGLEKIAPSVAEILKKK